MASADESVLSLCEKVWQWRLVESPELASFCGFHQFDHLWDDISEEAYVRRQASIEEFLNEAKSIDVSTCSPEVSLTYTLLLDGLESYLAGSPFRSYLMPISYLEGIHVEMNQSILYMKFDTEQDFEKYIQRLKSLPARLRQVISIMQKGIEEGIVQHKSSVKMIPEQLENIAGKIFEENDMMKPFKEEHPGVTPAALENFKAEAQTVWSNEVTPALCDLKTYLEDVYIKKCRDNEGINTLKNGVKWYEQCLDFHLSCSMTPQEVHKLGLEEVARIKKQIVDLATKEGLPTNLQELLGAMENKQKGFFKTQEDVLDHVKNLCSNRIRPKISEYFKDLPDIPMVIKPSPSYMTSGPMGYYLNGTPDGSREGVYYINASDLNDCFPFTLPALSLHEGEPGHHLQGIYSLAATHLPAIRRYCEDSKYYLSPAKFSFYTAYVEGWGLYCEGLGEEMGIYLDSLEMLGRYNMEIFRAARLAVDTGLHAFGWSREKAIEYMLENTMHSRAEVTQEVERYITWPGQACAYKVGELKIWELRKKAEQQMGTEFDIKEFHHRILNCGAVPLGVLEGVVDKYINENGN